MVSDALRASDGDARGFSAESSYIVQGDHATPVGSWCIPPETILVKRTLRGSKSVIKGFLGTVRVSSNNKCTDIKANG